jgi:hypothetical protein
MVKIDDTTIKEAGNKGKNNLDYSTRDDEIIMHLKNRMKKLKIKPSSLLDWT